MLDFLYDILFEQFSDRVIAAIGGIAGLGALIVSIRSARIAQRAMEISQEDFNKKKDNLDFYLVEAFQNTRQQSDAKLRVIAFHTSITNKSLSPNVLTSANVIVEFIRQDGTTGQVDFPYSSSSEFDFVGRAIKQIEIPSKISERSAITGWITISFDLEILGLSRVKKYTVQVRDAFGVAVSVDTYLIKEISA